MVVLVVAKVGTLVVVVRVVVLLALRVGLVALLGKLQRLGRGGRGGGEAESGTEKIKKDEHPRLPDEREDSGKGERKESKGVETYVDEVVLSGQTRQG
jgi:hypothetical protein